MTSAQRLKANRANAQSSTGPRSELGKARASKNARRHGLSVSIRLSPPLSAEAESLACEIAGEGGVPDILACARRIAEAQIELMRVRQAALIISIAISLTRSTNQNETIDPLMQE